MKASALIRLAIDKFLAINDGSQKDNAAQDTGDITMYICCALDRAARASKLNIDHPNNVLVQEVISEELGKHSTVYIALNRLYNRETGKGCFMTNQELQEFRFMFADFLAHYFESIGN